MLFGPSENWKTLQSMYDKRSYSYHKYWRRYGGISKTLASEVPKDMLSEIVADFVNNAVANSSSPGSFGELSRLKTVIASAYLVQWLEVEVNNGGFHQYYFNFAGYNAKETIDALRSFGLIKTARILSDSYDLILSRLGKNDFKVLQMRRELPIDDVFEELSEFSNSFLKYEENISESVNDSIDKNRMEIVTK